MVSGNLISTAGASMVTPFLMIYATDKLGIPLSAAVTLITINAGTTLVSSPVAGTLADKVGRKLVLNLSLTLSGLTYLGLRFAVTYPSLAALMACLGLANALYSVGADAMMADLVPSEKRVDAYAINRMMNNAGFAIGPAVGGFVAATSYKLSFLGGAIGMLTYSLLMFFLARETLERSRHPQTAGAAAILRYAKAPISESASPRNEGFGRLLRDGRYLAFLGTMSLGLSAPMLLWVFLAVYTKNYFGMPENVYGWLPTTNALMCVFVQYAVTRITRRHSTLPVVAAGMLIYALGVGSVAVMSGFWGFWISMVLLTFGELTLVPTATKFVADVAPAEMRGRYMSLYWVGWGLSRAAAPLIGGAISEHIGPRAIWLGGLVIGLGSALGLIMLNGLGWYRQTTTRAAEAEAWSRAED